MREVLSLSLTSDIVELVKRKTKLRGLKSVSSYIKNLIEEDVEYTISEKELLEAVEEADRDYKKGELITANSIADLL
jgi:hypothetical protein